MSVFRYLGVYVNSNNNINEVIKKRIACDNLCYCETSYVKIAITQLEDNLVL